MGVIDGKLRLTRGRAGLPILQGCANHQQGSFDDDWRTSPSLPRFT